MKAIAIEKYGEDSTFRLVDVTVPRPQAGQVQVAVRAFSINPMDVAGRMGMLSAPFTDNWSFPLVLGWDFAGDVVALGEGAAESGLAVGDRVFGALPSAHAANNGSYSEFCVADVTKIAKLPAGLSYAQGAALPIAGMTAYRAITSSLNVRPGQHILVQGGAGGVGSLAVQVAKQRGAFVAATAGPAHAELLREYGVDEVIDYHTTDPAAVLHDYDGVFDTVGDIATGLKVLKSDGTLITVAAQPSQAQQHDEKKHVAFQFTDGRTADLDALGELVASGKVKQVIQTVPFTPEAVSQAHEAVAGRHVSGKIVVVR
ncbi:MAG: NADP-dependent oxidoreductase [Bifidobacteriaceae bacterium]|nr:NADP-dependent oxidoreductase [Bifidobacteriaceae bacterium]MCI1915364.1 NADP-dependent oxidoreductase [Bifidobacteriaceae bacterium]